MKHSEMFESLEPPAHGWTRLKARLDERRTSPLRWAMAGAVVAVGGVALLLWSPPQRVDLLPAANGAVSAVMLGRGFEGEPAQLAGGQAAALVRLPSGDANVVMYRLAVLDSATTPAPSGPP